MSCKFIKKSRSLTGFFIQNNSNCCPGVLTDNLKSASNLNGNLNCSKELEHYAS